MQEVIVDDTLGRLGQELFLGLERYRNLTLEISLDATNKLSRMESPTLGMDIIKFDSDLLIRQLDLRLMPGS